MIVKLSVFLDGAELTSRDQSEPDQSINNLHGTTAIDAGDESGGDAPPGVGEGEADAEEGEPGVVAFEVLSVSHLGEGDGIIVEGFEVVETVVVRRGAPDVVVVCLLDRHRGVSGCHSSVNLL